MEKFVEVWAGIWEKDEKTPEMPWMQKVKMALREKVKNVKEFSLTEIQIQIQIQFH